MKKTIIKISLLLLLLLPLQFIPSAFAASDWSDLQMLVSWTDGSGNPQSAMAVPLEWSTYNTFWVQVTNDAPLNGLMLSISHPNHPGYEFTPDSGELLSNVQNALSLESNAIYITAFNGNQMADQYVLYISTNITPTPTPENELKTPAPIQKPTGPLAEEVLHQLWGISFDANIDDVAQFVYAEKGIALKKSYETPNSIYPRLKKLEEQDIVFLGYPVDELSIMFGAYGNKIWIITLDSKSIKSLYSETIPPSFDSVLSLFNQFSEAYGDLDYGTITFNDYDPILKEFDYKTYLFPMKDSRMLNEDALALALATMSGNRTGDIRWIWKNVVVDLRLDEGSFYASVKWWDEEQKSPDDENPQPLPDDISAPEEKTIQSIDTGL